MAKRMHTSVVRILGTTAIVCVVVGLAACGGSVETTVGDGGVGVGGEGGTGSEAGLPFEECASVSELASNERGPADVIFAIDNTPSMYNEIEMLRANMNRFSEMVESEGLNLRIVLIACLDQECIGDHDNWWTVCIDPPVGAGACPADDTNLPDYLHVNHRIESLKALENIIDTYGDWSSMIRDDSAKHVVVISDDTDEWTASQFITALTGLDSRFEGFQFHAIYSYLSKDEACALPDDPCCDYAAPDGEGVIYRELVATTDGVSGNLCLQDFDPVFNQFATAVVASARLSCNWTIPPPPDEETLDVAKVNVEFVDGSGTSLTIGQVSDASQCSLVGQGWYYDDPVSPTAVVMCPQTCESIQGQLGAQIKIHFGCETELAPIL